MRVRNTYFRLGFRISPELFDVFYPLLREELPMRLLSETPIIPTDPIEEEPEDLEEDDEAYEEDDDEQDDMEEEDFERAWDEDAEEEEDGETYTQPPTID